MGETAVTTLDIKRIIEMLPHRYPILLVDRVIDMKEGESIVGLKNVTMNEPHFMGHFPDFPVMPGVLIIEAMAQTAALLVVHSLGKEMSDCIKFANYCAALSVKKVGVYCLKRSDIENVRI